MHRTGQMITARLASKMLTIVLEFGYMNFTAEVTCLEDNRKTGSKQAVERMSSV